VLDLGGDFVVTRFLRIGLFERDDHGSAGSCLLDLLLLFVLLGLRRRLGAHGRAMLEERARIGLAGVRRHDRIAVEVVELLAGLRVFALGTAILFGQFLPL